MRVPVLTLLALIGLPAQAQWKDVRKITTGGESTVATDNKGNVYITSHQPCELMISRDWGETFAEKHSYPDGLGDMHISVWGSGRVHLTYMVNGASGIKNHYSFDSGKTMREGGRLDGPLDREWIAPNFRTGEVNVIYSEGYIGGPKSKGIFVAKTTDYGRTFGKPVRVDIEPETSFAVDPYISSTPGGKLYAAWGTSKDYNTIGGLGFAYSADGGKTWKGHQTLATMHGDLGDTQERWMLGGIVSTGEDRVIAYYQDYTQVEVDGKTHKPLLTYMRISDDGGTTFAEARTVVPMDEIKASLRSYAAAFNREEAYPIYIQTLPWMAADAAGKIHLALVDNRTGQTAIENRVMNRWGVRYLQMAKGAKEFGPSEQVSQPFAAVRPPLDFNSIAVDSKYVYVTWSENPNSPTNGDFSGELYLGRKALQ
jgi:hypothetical protein